MRTGLLVGLLVAVSLIARESVRDVRELSAVTGPKGQLVPGDGRPPIPPEDIPSLCNATIPSFYRVFRSEYVNLCRNTWDLSNIHIRSKGVPDHCSPYFCPELPPGDCGHDDWCANDNPGFNRNPNYIVEQNFEFTIPTNVSLRPNTQDGFDAAGPDAAGTPIGIAVNGVALYSQYAGGVGAGDALEEEGDGFDQYNGHPEGSDIYHYHIDPVWITDPSITDPGPYADQAGLVGVMRDGIPLYGPLEPSGDAPDLDEFFHGHWGPVPMPDGRETSLWHYHVTVEAPYFLDRFKGKRVGTFVNLP